MNDQEQLLYMQARLCRIASKRWGESVAGAMRVFIEYHVPEYIEDGFDIFHVQGDEANMDDIEEYIRCRGADTR